MKLAFDAKRLFHNQTGLGNYSRSLVRGIRNLSADAELYLFTPNVENTNHIEFLGSDYQLCLGDNRFLWRLKNMTKDLSRIKPEIYHGLSNELPVGIENLPDTKSIVTIHDLIFLHYPHFYPLSDRILYKEKSKRACKKADHIIAISEATKTDIINFYNIEEERISVVYQGTSPDFYHNYVIEEESEIRPYFLFVSSLNRRKNLELIIKALATIGNQERPHLKIVGRGGKYEVKMRQLAAENKVESSIEFLGVVDNKSLIGLYKNATASIYPSLMEGFGIPIVESMLMGTPVITSNRSSMPEATNGLGTLVNPSSVEEMRSAMIHYLNSKERLSSSEVEQIKKKYNPERQAKEVLQLYHKVLGH